MLGSIISSYIRYGGVVNNMRLIDRYLGKLIKARLRGEKAENMPDGVSVEDIVTIAHRSQMNTLLLSALVNVDNISDMERVGIRQIIIRSIMKTSAQIQESRLLETKFEEAGVVNQPMKGSVLRLLYPSPELREMCDLDILIAKDNMDKAVNILNECGYELKESIKHHDIYIKKPYMIVEAHRAMYDKTVDKNQSQYFDNFSRTSIKEGCKYTHVFGKEDFYVYMMAHMAKHFYQTGCGIRHLVDIYVYLNLYNKEMDRIYIDKELEGCGILTFTKHMEKLAYAWLDDEEIEEVYSDMFVYMLDSGIYGKDENGIWNKLSEDDVESVSRTHLKRWYYFPPLYYMSEYYPYLSKKPWLLPWAWLVRGVGGLLAHKGERKRHMIDDIDMDSVQKLKRIYKTVGLKFGS